MAGLPPFDGYPLVAERGGVIPAVGGAEFAALLVDFCFLAQDFTLGLLGGGGRVSETEIRIKATKRKKSLHAQNKC